ncbi:TPA: LPXTG cell wall anchor domain-containing protein, partial [Enterococcus faecalis]|nr:LPXTG cell wall anchor domain-containing protein [Enterococcus faecalis]
GTPTDTTVGKKPYNPDEHKPTVNQPNKGENAKEHNMSKNSSSNFPKTGEVETNFNSILGLLGSAILGLLFWRKKNNEQ